MRAKELREKRERLEREMALFRLGMLCRQKDAEHRMDLDDPDEADYRRDLARLSRLEGNWINLTECQMCAWQRIDGALPATLESLKQACRHAAAHHKQKEDATHQH